VNPTSARPLSIYKTKWFARFARKARISDQAFWKAALDADAGFVDADLGSGIIKQRVARQGEGKSGGSRAYIVIRRHNRAVYVFGFEKKDQANIKPDEWEPLKKLAKEILSYSEADIAKNVRTGELIKLDEVEEENGGEI
jgi:hypothetical protein